LSDRLANKPSHTVFWLVITVVAAAFFFAGEKNLPEPEPAMNNKPISDATDARSDTLVASRKITGDENQGNLQIPFSQPIATARVNDLLVDTRGTLWVATENGICSINNGEVKEFSEAKGTFSAPQAECLAFDGQKLWVGTFFGLFSITRSGRIEKHSISSAPGSEIILDLYHDGISLWVGTQAGAALMDKEGKFVIIDSKISNGGMRNDWCQSIMRFSGWFVVAHDSGISFWNTGFKASNPEFWKNIDNARSGIIRPVTGLTFDGKHIWIATARGVLYLTTPLEKLFSESVSNFINFTTMHGLPDNRINAIISHRGSIWVGTNVGLARISDDRIQTIVPADGSGMPKVKALAASGDILWLGTDRGVQFINTAMVE
jgi:ligand-binding sensor domain-containing protein